MELLIIVVLAAALVAACVFVILRRGHGSSAGGHGRAGDGSDGLDAQARSASQRGSDRQGMGPF